jgi:type IV pilus assembly protein PilM
MPIGLDIGSKTIKIVELAKDGDRWKLKASGMVGHNGIAPEHSKTDKELMPVAEAIRKLYKDAKISSREVNIALPEPQVSTRTVSFPLLTDAEISSAVKWEAEQYIPFPINEAVIQHQVIERRENVSPPQVIVLLVATPKELVEKYAKVVEMAGLKLYVVETDLLALTRSLAPTDRTVMIVDFGARSTNIAIARNGYLNFSRSIPTAGEAFTRAVSQGLGIEAKQAEEYKRTYGLQQASLEGKIRTAIDPVLRMVSDEIKKAIHYYQSEEKGESPSSIILSGGSAGMPEIASALTKLVGFEVVIGNPFSNVNIDPAAVQYISGYAPFYSVSVGLAMREE